MQLERLQAEAHSRTKRERRKANEKRTKVIQRIQLSMTAPMDIGQEFSDAQLARGEEVFGLAEAEERGMRDVDASSSSSSGDDEETQDGMSGSEDEHDRMTRQLEGALDDMYDTYRQRMAERDAKWKAREARAKDKKNDAWAGVRRDSDDESSDGESDGEGVSARKIATRIAPQEYDGENDGESEEGGWDAMQAAKDRDSGSDSDSDADSDEHDGEMHLRTRKKLKGIDGSATLITSLDDGKANLKPSRVAQLWFSQDVFKGIGNIDDIEDDETGSDATGGESSNLASVGDREVSCSSASNPLTGPNLDFPCRHLALPKRKRSTISKSYLRSLMTTSLCGMLMIKMKNAKRRKPSKVRTVTICELDIGNTKSLSH